jgi:CheY-like chemotaxis protein
MAKILLVEDEPDNRDLIGMTLEMDGHEMCYAGTGEEGLEQARHARPHLILMDLSLPGGMNGLETTRQLRMDAAFNEVPIIALTAHAMRGDREHALSAGCDEYISKPIVDLQDFSATISSLITRGRPNRD